MRQGHDVVFASCAQLLASLNAPRAIGNYERKLLQLARVPVLIIDDFGLKPLHAPADEDLHDLIAERYEQAAAIVTSTLDFTVWDQAFPGNRLLASATVDRLRHNAYCLTLDVCPASITLTAGQANCRRPTVSHTAHLDRGPQTRQKRRLQAPRKTANLDPPQTSVRAPFRWLSSRAPF